MPAMDFTKLGMAVPATLMSMTELYNLCDGTRPWDLRSLLTKSSSLFSGALHRLRTLRGIQGVGYKLQGQPMTVISTPFLFDEAYVMEIWKIFCYISLF